MENDSDELEMDPRINEITGTIIGASYAVSNALGAGFLEKVYENAMVVELEHRGLKVVPQYPVPIFYRGVQVGDYYVDLLVEESVLVELKAVNHLVEAFTAKCLNYLRGSGKHLCLLINFGQPRVTVKRFRL